MEPQYKLEEDGYFIEKDATFSIKKFMADLERFYQAMRMDFAFEQMCLGNDEPALALHEDGQHFSGIPFFEQYRYAPEDTSKIDYSPARGDLLKEMQLDAEVAKNAETEAYVDARFARPVFYDYEKLQEKLVDMIPDFCIRLKVHPKTRKLVFAADVHSVFDICWYTLARKLSEDVAPEDKGTGKDTKEPHEGVVLSCPYCGEAFVRRSNRAITCGREECNRARKRKNKQDSRQKQKIEKMQGE